jgi:MFS family permease
MVFIFCGTISIYKTKNMQKLKHDEKLNKDKIFLINIISLLMSFAGGLLIYTTSAYFKNITNYTVVGWFFLIANTLLLIALFNIHKIVYIIGREILFQLLLIIKISIFIALAFTTGAISGVFFLIIFIVCEALSWVVLKMILEDNSIDKQTGQIYGFNLMMINIGLVLAPIIASVILMSYNFVGIFYFSIFLNVFIFLFTFLKLKPCPNQRLQSYSSNILSKFKLRSNIQYIFFISFMLEFFFAIMVIYTPLYLLQNNFTWQQIGIIFSVMIIPLILIPYPFGILADKRHNEKKLLFFSFVLIIFSSIFLYLSKNPTTITVMIILFISRIGASLVSILRLSYFYKQIDKNDTDMISIFYMARPLAFILAPALASVILIFFPLNNVFALLAIFTSFALYPITKLVYKG